MLNKKGFTLIELLAVLVILGIIGMIAFPAVQTLITKNKQKLYKKQIGELINATSKYIVDHDAELLHLSGDNTCYLEVNNLIENGYLKNTGVKDPITGNSLNGKVYIKWSDEYNQYEYKYKNEDTEHENKDYLSGSDFYSTDDNWFLSESVCGQ